MKNHYNSKIEEPKIHFFAYIDEVIFIALTMGLFGAWAGKWTQAIVVAVALFFGLRALKKRFGYKYYVTLPYRYTYILTPFLHSTYSKNKKWFIGRR